LEEENKAEDTKEEKEDTIRSDKVLIATIIIFILIVAGFAVWMKFLNKTVVVNTIDDLHKLNIKGKLDSQYGYVYKGYSFVYSDGLWYTQIQTKQGGVMFDLPMHYGPREVEDVEIYGSFNYSIFNENKEIYVTFDPLGKDENFKYISVAIGEFDQPIIKAFNKLPIAACDKEAEVCSGRPIVTCDNRSLSVLYIKDGTSPRVELDGNCLIVSGDGLGIIKAVDRLLLTLYGIM